MNRLVFWALVSALAGFLFGFDAAVISGAEQKIEQLWKLTKGQHGLAVSAALWGTVFGSLFGGVPTDFFGRKKTLIFIGLMFLGSAIWSALAGDYVSFVIARVIGGVGVGISTVCAPLYISEIAPSRRRGLLAGLFQFNIVFGVLIAFVSNAIISRTEILGEQQWRWMLGIEAIPALIYSLMCFLIPESPRWLIAQRGDREGGLKIFQMINPEMDMESLDSMVDQIAGESKPAKGAGNQRRFFSANMKIPILLVFLIAFFNQLSGINAILYYAPRIFEKTGLEEQSALLQTIGIGVTNLIFTFVGLGLIDRLGRKTLLLIGSVGYIVSLGLCAWAFQSENFGWVPVFLFAFIAAHAIGQGAVIWVFIAEIFPNQFRATGQALGCFVHWIFAATLTLVFPSIVENLPAEYVFGFFAFMMVLQLFWVLLMVPETKGVPLEEIQQNLGVK